MKSNDSRQRDAETYFLVSQEDIYKIDSLIGALNFAIAEILEMRPVKSKSFETTPRLWEYDEQINAIIDTGELDLDS